MLPQIANILTPFPPSLGGVGEKPAALLVELPPLELRGQIPALDAIRGLAIIMVTIYRFGAADVDFSVPGMEWFEPLKALNKGVDLFFVLSGFLITGILFDSKPQPHFFRNFYARRSLRIFPLYYGTLLLMLVLLPLTGWLRPDTFAEASRLQGWLWLYGTNIWQGIQGKWCFGRFNHFWSLAVEEHFYLVWPLVIYVANRRQAMWACGTLALFSLVARAWYTWKFGDQMAEVGAESFTWLRLDSLALGGWAALAARGPGGLQRLVPFAWIGSIGSLSTMLLMFIAGKQRLLHIPFTLFAVFFTSFLIFAVTARPESWLGWCGRNRILRFFGKYSYGMYVFQNLLIVLVAGWLSPTILAGYGGSSFAGQTLYLMTMFGLTTLVAMLSWHLYEKHFMGLKKYFEARH